MKVYLAGPITGLTYEGSTNWRDYAKKKLAGGEVFCVNDNDGDGDCAGCAEWWRVQRAGGSATFSLGYEPLCLSRSSETGIVGYSPMRAKDYLKSVGTISGRPEAYEDRILSSAKGITYRDGWDVDTCDVLLINFLGAETISAGTVWEIGRASARQKPIVCAMEESNVHQHPIINTSIGWITPDLDMAIDIVKAILLPDGVTVSA